MLSLIVPNNVNQHQKL